MLARGPPRGATAVTDHSTARPTSPFAPERRAPAGALLLALLVPLACVYYLGVQRAVTGALGGLPLDDSWIHLVFARSLAAGEGLAFNPGELVPASTAPLWTALLALVHLLPFDPVLPVKLLGVALATLAVLESARLARALGLPRPLAVLAAAAVAMTDWLAWAALSGMEIPLFTLLSLAGMRLHAEESAGRRAGRLSLLLLALAVLARPEGLLLLLLAVVERAAGSDRRGLARLRGMGVDLALVAVLLVPMALFNFAVSGSPLPTTFAAKAGGVRHLLPDLHTLYLAFGLLFRSHPVLALLAGGGALELAARRLAGHRVALLPALWLFALPVALSLLGGAGGAVLGNFGRYLFPLFPVLAVVGCAALARPLAAVAATAGDGPRRVRWAAVLVVPLVLGPGLFVLVRGGGRYAQSVANVETSDVRLARWLTPRLAPEALLAVADVGAMKYLLPNRLIDLGALVTPELHAELRREGDLPPEEALARFLARRGVDFVAVYPRFLPAFERDPARFAPLVRLAIPDNITMAGDELVLYRTGWCAHPLREPPEPAAAPDPTRRSTP